MLIVLEAQNLGICALWQRNCTRLLGGWVYHGNDGSWHYVYTTLQLLFFSPLFCRQSLYRYSLIATFSYYKISFVNFRNVDDNFVGLLITSRLRMDEDVQMNGDDPQRSVMSINRRL